MHGIVYCGECGHKLVVQYKCGPVYICNHLRTVYQTSVCQRIPAQPIDDCVVQAFFQAISPIEMNAYEQALQTQSATAQRVTQAQEQQLERLRYQAALAQRQYNQVDPDNRLVAAELEYRWEGALVALKQAEEIFAIQQRERQAPLTLPDELKNIFVDIAQQLPLIWDQEEVLSTPHKKALLRALIDKVVIHRTASDQVQTRIVWKGGETSTYQIRITVGSFSRLSTAAEMEKTIIELSQQGQSDEQIAQYLTSLGHASPKNPKAVLTSTVRIIRQKNRIHPRRKHAQPRRVPGCLTIPQIAEMLSVTTFWIYHCISSGKISVNKDPQTRLYLFPDQPETLEKFQQLKTGKTTNLCFL